MPLTYERYRGHDFSRRICTFSMLNGDDPNPVRCMASWELMDDLSRSTGTKAGDRDAQFEQLQGVLADMASRKFFSFTDGHRPTEILITREDRRL